MSGIKKRMSGIKKRSIAIGGRKTSVCLEDEFWESLGEIARKGRKSSARMIADIKAKRKSSNLSSSIRLFILRYYRDRDQSKQSNERAASPLGRSGRPSRRLKRKRRR